MLEQRKSTQLLNVIVLNLLGVLPLVEHIHNRIGPHFGLNMKKTWNKLDECRGGKKNVAATICTKKKSCSENSSHEMMSRCCCSSLVTELLLLHQQ